MNRLSQSLLLTVVSLLALSFNSLADASLPAPKMQRYIFTYHFDKQQSDVIKLARETQQLIYFQLIVDTQNSAYNAIYSITDNLVTVAASNSDDEEVNLTAE